MTDTTKPRVRLIRGDVIRPFATEPRGEVPPIGGTVRLVSAREVRDFYDGEFPDLKKRLGNAVLAEAHLFARCLKSWDVLGDTDATADITPENVAALPEGAFLQLYGVVTGTAAAEPVLKN